MLNVATGQFANTAKVGSDEFTETRRIVVSDRLSITKGLQRRVGLHNLLFQSRLLKFFFNFK